MWSRSIEVLNPYEATMDALAREYARSPKPRTRFHVPRWMKSLGRRKARPQ